ncbi:MAG: MarR family winged helix-turn-helix transcriptional regulator [Muribaculaceae bacterium]|nr:MarR family winged helix-turn-helix transcriptional regulator [Muribaculaceae bacterium]
MKKEIPHIESPAVGCMLGKAYQILLSQLAKALSDAGLEITTTEYLVLRALYSDEGIQQCEIASLTGKDKASICRCVSGLEKKSLVKTECVSHKCLRVYLTEQAREIEPRVMNVANIRHNVLLSMLSPSEFENFTKVLEKIITT